MNSVSHTAALATRTSKTPWSRPVATSCARNVCQSVSNLALASVLTASRHLVPTTSKLSTLFEPTDYSENAFSRLPSHDDCNALISIKPWAYYGESFLQFFVHTSNASAVFHCIEDYSYTLASHISTSLHTPLFYCLCYPCLLLSGIGAFGSLRRVDFLQHYLGESLIWSNAFGCNEWGSCLALDRSH
jgi:hypothetical protein